MACTIMRSPERTPAALSQENILVDEAVTLAAAKVQYPYTMPLMVPLVLSPPTISLEVLAIVPTVIVVPTVKLVPTAALLGKLGTPAALIVVVAVPPKEEMPKTLSAPAAVTAPVRVEVSPTDKVPPVEMLVLIVVAASARATTQNTPTATPTILTSKL